MIGLIKGDTKSLDYGSYAPRLVDSALGFLLSYYEIPAPISFLLFEFASPLLGELTSLDHKS